MTHPADLDLTAAAAALRAGGLTSSELTRATLDRIAERDRQIGAFVHLDPEGALAAASAADQALAEGQDRGPLHGIPFGVKDVFDVAGWPVRFGCAHYRDRIAADTADAVAALVAAGAIPLGLVATYEMATVGPDTTSLYPQPRNPWDRDRFTGGSSSGSAAAVSAGMVRFALGSDTGGSARSPAAYCGVVGMKPTAGRLSKAGLMPLAPSMDQVGILAASAAEAALVLAALSGGAAGQGPAATRIAYGRGWAQTAPEDGAILTLMDDAAAALSLAGHRIDIVGMPDYAQIEQAGTDILLHEQIAARRSEVAGDPDHVGQMAWASLAQGLSIRPDTVETARRAAVLFTEEIDAILADHDALILPTTMDIAPPFSAFASGVPVWTAMRTIPFNLSGHPALTVPIGFHRGLPLGMQIVGTKGADARVLQIGAAFEAATDHAVMRPYRA
ncbi:MAG: amidase [Rhodobacteraceae bacterium]|nr:amidase [Paracoccaceae bacterium]